MFPKRNEIQESRCQQSIIYFSFILSVICSCTSSVLLYLCSTLTNNTFLPTVLFTILQNSFIASTVIFVVAFLLLIINAAYEYIIFRRLCSCTNFRLIILSVLLIYPYTWSVVFVNQQKERFDSFLVNQNSVDNMNYTNNKDSPLFDLSSIIGFSS